MAKSKFMSKIAIFASGKGSNAAVLIDYFNHSGSDIQVALLISNRKEAGAISLARSKGLETHFFSNEVIMLATPVLELLKKEKIDWIVLAGFLRKIPTLLIEHYPDRIINIHPSLLPKYGGKGMYGKKVHQAVIAAGEKESGISIHLVNEAYDEGQILKQGKCTIEAGETAESLEAKIRKLEHDLFPVVIESFIKSSQ